MKRIIFVSLMFAAVSCTKDMNSDSVLNSSVTASQSTDATTLTLRRNTKFGCMINGNFDDDGRVSVAKSLNVSYVRSSITMSEWSGKSWSYETYVNNGIKVVLN